MEYRQVVRQWTLNPSYKGSIPFTPVKLTLYMGEMAITTEKTKESFFFYGVYSISILFSKRSRAIKKK